MGLFSRAQQDGQSAQRSGSSLLNRVPSSKNCSKKPSSEAEIDALVAAMRAAFADAALTHAQLTQGGEEGLTRTQCKRWLAARGWDPARAAHDLSAHAAWRAAFAPNGRVADSEVRTQLAQRKVLYQGLDRRGRPVVVLVGGNHIPTADPADVQRFYCYASDACIANADLERNPEGRAVFIIDVGDFGWKNFDVLGAKALFGMMSQHYVERLSHVYVHNAGSLLMQLYKLVSPFIDPVTRDKVVFLPRDPAAAGEVLARDIDLHVLPPNLGGSSEPRPIECAWADADARRAPAKAAAVAGGRTPSVDLTVASNGAAAVAVAAAAAFDEAAKEEADGSNDDEGSEVWLDANDGSDADGGLWDAAASSAHDAAAVGARHSGTCALVGRAGRSDGGGDDVLVDIDAGPQSAAAALAEKADGASMLRAVAVRA